VDALRDAGPADLEAPRVAWPDEATRRRARHVVTENARTLRAAEALTAGDDTTMGRLMDESHASLREDFEVSTAALDLMADCARRAPGCLGARMTGAGFGGCVVALVRRERVDAFVSAVAAPYERATGLTAKVYAVTAAAGAEVCP
jgi:galactokinase